MITKQGGHAAGGAKNYIVNGNMTGGFAILAYPAEYRSSGVMTLMINQDGTVYEKDLGARTSDLAKAITEFDPDALEACGIAADVEDRRQAAFRTIWAGFLLTR